MRVLLLFIGFFGLVHGVAGQPALYWSVANNDALEVWKAFSEGVLSVDPGFDPQEWAVDRGSAEVLDVLQWKGIKLDRVDDQGRNLLFGAAALGRMDIFRKILADGANVGQTDLEGRTLAHAAAASPHPAMLHYLLTQGLDPRGKTGLGITPLMTACGGGRSEAAALLLAWGAVPEDEDYLGRSVRDYAVAGGDKKTLDLIDAAITPWTAGPDGGAPLP